MDARDRGEELADALGDDAYGEGDWSCSVEEYESSEVCIGEISREVRRRLRDECEDGEAGAGDRDRPEDPALARRSGRLAYGWDDEAAGE